MSAIFVLIGVILFLLGVVALFKPLPKLRLSNKGAAAIAMVLGVASCAVGGATMSSPDSLGAAERTDAAADAIGSPTAGDARLALGASVRVRSADVAVTSVESRDRVGIEYAYDQASEGGTLVVVRYSVTNVGERPLSFFQPRVRLLDPNGVEYNSDAGKTASLMMEGGVDAKAWSDLNPGITTRDAAVFEVSSQSFDPETWSVIVENKRNRFAMR